MGCGVKIAVCSAVNKKTHKFIVGIKYNFLTLILGAFPYRNGMVLHFYQQQESSTTKTVHRVINKGLKAYV